MKGTNPIRKLEPRDCPAITEIEKASFRDPWTREDFALALARSDILAYVYAPSREVLAYLILQVEDPNLHIMNLGVHPDHRRQGIALKCLRFAERLARQRGAHRLDLEVQESNLPAQLLYRKAGYRAIRILRNYYSDTQEDGYRMVRSLVKPASAASRLKGIL